MLPKEFIVYSDHQSLKHFGNQRHVDRMLARWAAYLERFNYLIMHKSGITNRVADALSRRACLLTSFEAELPGMGQIKELYEGDEDFGHVWVKHARGQPLGDDYLMQDGYLLKMIAYAFQEVLYVTSWLESSIQVILVAMLDGTRLSLTWKLATFGHN